MDKSKREQVEDLRLWLSISNLRNVPHSLLLISRAIDFAKDSIIHDEDEQMNEDMIQVSVFRRCFDMVVVRNCIS